MPDHLEERAIVGTPAECRRRLDELDDELGLTKWHFIFTPERAILSGHGTAWNCLLRK